MDELRELYLADLRKLVDYKGNLRPRVSKVDAIWAKIESTIQRPIRLEDYDNIWVWSDQHFGHAKIIEYTDRPFEEVMSMTERLVENHNQVVGDDDLVIWGGDVAFMGVALTNEILGRLKGERLLVIGNHDINRKKKAPKVMDFAEQHLLYTIEDNDVKLLFTHYPMEPIPDGWINVHGHTHNAPHSMDQSMLHINVSVEMIDYTPINLEEIKRIARTRLESLDGKRSE